LDRGDSTEEALLPLQAGGEEAVTVTPPAICPTCQASPGTPHPDWCVQLESGARRLLQETLGSGYAISTRDVVAYSQHLAHRVLHSEQDAHAATAKQLVDKEAVLGCIEKRVARFQDEESESELWNFVADLNRMLGVES
jgi:hypothetical protein